MPTVLPIASVAYVDAAARGQGPGRAQIEAGANDARRCGSPVLHWKTRATSATALALYASFAQRNEFVSAVRPPL